MADSRSPRSPRKVDLTIDVPDGLQIVSNPSTPVTLTEVETPVAILVAESEFPAQLAKPLLDNEKKAEIAATVAAVHAERENIRLTYLAAVHAQMEQDDDDALRLFFETRSQVQRRYEINYAIAELEENIGLIGNNTRHPAYVYKEVLVIILAGIKASKGKPSDQELPILIEFTHETARFAQNPHDVKNNRRLAVSTERASKCSWGRWIGGAAAMLLGAGLIAGGIMLACSSGGIATPLAGVAAWLGEAAVAWGAAAVVGGGGLAMYGGYWMGTSRKYGDASNPARALFAPPPPPPPIEGNKMADILASQYTPGGTRRRN